MISIRKYIERNDAELLCATRDSYIAALEAIGEGGMQACPAIGFPMREKLRRLQTAFSAEDTPDAIRETGEKVEAELTQWGSGAAHYFKQRAVEVKELIMILAHTAEHTGERDQRYSRQFQEFSGRLEAMADLHDLALIRDSLIQSATSLKACVAAMAEESQQSVARLRSDLGVYQARLDDAEREAGQDALTGLDNRRRVEAATEFRVALKKPFAVLALDLNGFKQINDTYGHLAADEILKQFSAELKSGFRVTDVVGRTGGDEFIVVTDAGLKEAKAHMARISRWVCGNYVIRVAGGTRKVPLSAAMGAAEWQPDDTPRSLLERADAAMYCDKRAQSKSKK